MIENPEKVYNLIRDCMVINQVPTGLGISVMMNIFVQYAALKLSEEDFLETLDCMKIDFYKAIEPNK